MRHGDMRAGVVMDLHHAQGVLTVVLNKVSGTLARYTVVDYVSAVATHNDVTECYSGSRRRNTANAAYTVTP